MPIDDVPDLIGRRDRASLPVRIACGLGGAVVGTFLGALIGAYGYNLIYPPRGCGNIGCWDWLQGAMVGALAGLIGGPLAAERLLRRIVRARRT